MSKKTGSLIYFCVFISCALMAGASLGLCLYSAGVFYDPIAQGLNLSSGQVSLITTFMLVCMAVTALFLPHIMKILRYRYLLVAGTILAAGGTLGMSFCFNAPWLYLCAVFQGIGAALIGLVPVTTTLNNWFYSHNAGITSIVIAMPAVVAALLSPLFSLALEGLGWRMALVVEAVFIVLFLLPALLGPFSLKPEQIGMRPYGIRDLETQEVRKEKKKTPVAVFFIIAAISILAALLLGIPQHFSEYAVSLNESLLFGASLFSMAMIGNIVFKLIGGYAADRMKAGMSAALLDIVSILAAIGLLFSGLYKNELALRIFAFLFGAVYGLSELTIPLLVKEQYGNIRYPRIYSMMNFLATVTMAISIALVGFLYDAAKTFTWVFVIALIILLLLLVLIYILIQEEKMPKAIASYLTKKMPANKSITKSTAAKAKGMPEETQKQAEPSDQNASSGSLKKFFTRTRRKEEPEEDELSSKDSTRDPYVHISPMGPMAQAKQQSGSENLNNTGEQSAAEATSLSSTVDYQEHSAAVARQNAGKSSNIQNQSGQNQAGQDLNGQNRDNKSQYDNEKQNENSAGSQTRTEQDNVTADNASVKKRKPDYASAVKVEVLDQPENSSASVPEWNSSFNLDRPQNPEPAANKKKDLSETVKISTISTDDSASMPEFHTGTIKKNPLKDKKDPDESK